MLRRIEILERGYEWNDWHGSDVFPIEVKSETNLKAKSLRTYHEKFSPKISIRTSMMDYKREEWLLNLPLWAINTLHMKLS